MLHPMGMQEPKPKFEYRDRSQIRLGRRSGALIAAIIRLAPSGSCSSRGLFGLRKTVVTGKGRLGGRRHPPRLLAAMWIYGYSCGVGSARALERMQAHEPGLRWLCADDVVNHHTLSDFRSRDSQALDALFTQVLAAHGAGAIGGFEDGGSRRDQDQSGERRGSYHRKRR